MKTTSFILASFLLSVGILAQSLEPRDGFNCNGDIFSPSTVQYCCVHGKFSGPVVSSFLASMSSFQSSLQASLSAMTSDLGNMAFLPTFTDDTDSAAITPAPKMGKLMARTITTEVTSGLTCVGDSVDSSTNAGFTGMSVGDKTSSSGSGSSSSTSKAGVPMVTPGPVLAMGAAAAAFAYGAM